MLPKIWSFYGHDNAVSTASSYHRCAFFYSHFLRRPKYCGPCSSLHNYEIFRLRLRFFVFTCICAFHCNINYVKIFFHSPLLSCFIDTLTTSNFNLPPFACGLRRCMKYFSRPFSLLTFHTLMCGRLRKNSKNFKEFKKIVYFQTI